METRAQIFPPRFLLRSPLRILTGISRSPYLSGLSMKTIRKELRARWEVNSGLRVLCAPRLVFVTRSIGRGLVWHCICSRGPTVASPSIQLGDIVEGLFKFRVSATAAPAELCHEDVTNG
jgi:hypothetical protein